MPANSIPRFTRVGKVSSTTVTAANTKSDGSGTIGTDTFLAFTADSTNGSFVERVRWLATATASTATTATVARVYISSVTSGATTSANTYLVAEVTLPSVTADSSSAAVQPIDVPLGISVPASYTVLVQCYAAPAANTAWRATVFGGDY